jgi:hypothetical protein
MLGSRTVILAARPVRSCFFFFAFSRAFFFAVVRSSTAAVGCTADCSNTTTGLSPLISADTSPGADSITGTKVSSLCGGGVE